MLCGSCWHLREGRRGKPVKSTTEGCLGWQEVVMLLGTVLGKVWQQ